MNSVYILRNANRDIMGTFTDRLFAEAFQENTIEFQRWESSEVEPGFEPEATNWTIDWFPVNQ